MADYSKVIAWSGKDALADSSAAKIISGADFHTEFTAVEAAVNTKADINGDASEAFSATTASADTNTTQVATTAYVQTEIGNLGTNGDGARTVSTSAASGGSDGDIWYQVAS
jgi:hypothetical protein